MADLLGKSWGLETPDLLQQMAMLAWLNGDDSGKDMLKNLTQMRIGVELYNRVSGQKDIEKWEQECILGIANYVKSNPKAPDDLKAKEIQKHIDLFKSRVDSL